MLNHVLTSLHSSGSIRGGITLAWNVSTIASRTVGMNFAIVFFCYPETVHQLSECSTSGHVSEFDSKFQPRLEWLSENK